MSNNQIGLITILVIVASGIIFYFFPLLSIIVFSLIVLIIIFKVWYELSYKHKIKYVQYLEKYGDDNELRLQCEKFNIDTLNMACSKDNYIKFLKIISNNQINNCNFTEEDMSLERVLEYLIEQDENYIVYLDWKDDLEESIYATNSVLKKLNCGFEVTKEQITSNDNKYIKNRRNDSVWTTEYDLNAINIILKIHNFEFVEFSDMGDCYALAVIPMNKVQEIKALMQNK